MDLVSFWLAAGVARLHAYGLLAPLVQLLLVTLFGFIFAERWQRWRQQRDFQHRAMVKFSELTMEQVVLLGELLVSRVGRPGVHAGTLFRQYMARRVPFHALEGEIAAAFDDAQLLADYYEFGRIARALSDRVIGNEPLNRESFEPLQDALLILRKLMVTRMIQQMGLMSSKDLALTERDLRPKVEQKARPVA
jgi:hypothetical protein